MRGAKYDKVEVRVNAVEIGRVDSVSNKQASISQVDRYLQKSIWWK